MSFKDNLYAHFFSNFLISFVLCFLDICCTTLIVFSGDGTISFTSFFGVLVITRSPDSLIQVPRSIFAIDVAGLMSKKKNTTRNNSSRFGLLACGLRPAV